MLKIFFDKLTSFMGLLGLLPLLFIIALMVRIRHGSPVIFFQTRSGLHGKPFTLYKFRTMNNATDNKGKLLPDEDRLTDFGNFLRNTSLDELPTLYNVLRGDMSLVGPRPLHMRYLPRYSDFQKQRHKVKPGITGWAQINGRNRLSWHKKFELDVWYVKNRSFGLDLKILVITFIKVFKQEGITAEGSATMSEFQGN